MAQIYDTQLGKLVDVSDEEYRQALNNAGAPPAPPQAGQPAPQVSGATAPAPTTSTSNPFGASLQDLYQAKGKALAAGDKSAASQFQSFIDLEEGFAESKEAETPDLGETERKFALGLDAATRARQLLEEGQATGPLQTRFQQLGEKFGKTKGTDFRASLALANTALKSAFLGSAQSTQEIEGLIDAISDPNQQEDVLKVKLDNLISIVEGRMPGMIPKGDLPEAPPALTEDREEGKTLAGIGRNALNDLQSLVEGAGNIPEMVKQLMSELPEKPSLLGPGYQVFRTPTGKALVKGTVDEYKNLITHPLEHFYDHPVNTILDVIPFLAGIKKLRAGRLAGKVDEVTDIARVTGKVDEIPKLPPELGLADETVAAGGAGILPSRARIASKTYSSAFIVPTKRAKNLRPIETSAKMLEYGVSGSLDDMSKITSSVTGDTGVLTKVTRNSIGGITGEISIGEASTSAKNMLKNVVDLTPNEESRILKNILRQEKTGKAVLTTNALDAYDTAKRLESLGHQQLNASTYLTKNVKAEGIGKAYLAASDEIMSRIEMVAKEQDILASFKTPEVIDQLNKISPKLADEFMQAKTLSDVRSLQAPFVRLNQMIDLTEQSANTAFQSMGRQVGGSIFKSAIGGGAGFAVGGPIGGVAGLVGGQLVGPPIEAAIEAARPGILTKTAKFIKR